jgi:hypothetical protein
MAECGDGDAACLVWLRSPNVDAADSLDWLANAYGSLFARNYGFTASNLDVKETGKDRAIVMEMPGIARIMAVEQGTHEFLDKSRGMILVQAIVMPLERADLAGDVLRSARETEERWRSRLRETSERSESAGDDQPFPLGPVVRMYDASSLTADVRSGLACRGLPAGEELRKFVPSQLPWPGELTEDSE